MDTHLLRTARDARGLSQETLAGLVGVTKKQIQRYEQGTQEPTLRVAARIAAELRVTIDALAGQPPADEEEAPVVYVDGVRYGPVSEPAGEPPEDAGVAPEDPEGGGGDSGRGDVMAAAERAEQLRRPSGAQSRPRSPGRAP